jgi:hypothetical protein
VAEHLPCKLNPQYHQKETKSKSYMSYYCRTDGPVLYLEGGDGTYTRNKIAEQHTMANLNKIS